jgi:hypothetical protein
VSDLFLVLFCKYDQTKNPINPKQKQQQQTNKQTNKQKTDDVLMTS